MGPFYPRGLPRSGASGMACAGSVPRVRTVHNFVKAYPRRPRRATSASASVSAHANVGIEFDSLVRRLDYCNAVNSERSEVKTKAE